MLTKPTTPAKTATEARTRVRKAAVLLIADSFDTESCLRRPARPGFD